LVERSGRPVAGQRVAGHGPLDAPVVHRRKRPAGSGSRNRPIKSYAVIQAVRTLIQLQEACRDLRRSWRDKD
jgi:hypothetical protein